MSRFSYREPAWLILTIGLLIGLTAGFGLGWWCKPTVRVLADPAYADPALRDPYFPRSNTLFEMGKKAAEESKREREAAGR